MRAPAFWWEPSPSPAAWLLAPLGALYGAVTARRMARPGERAALPVICVGNLTAGGAGKTPTALGLAAVAEAAGLRPAFLSRGYGGRLSGPVRVDPLVHGFRDVGDEPLLLARAAPTIVARDRPAGARACAALGAEVVIMDDGLQNPSLVKDLALAVVDAGVGVGNGRCLPAGPLRAPLDRQWPQVSAVILIGEGAPGDRVAREAERQGLPVLRARLVPEEMAVERLRGRRVLAFAGIGRPDKLFGSLRACGAEVVAARAFPDHHPFTAAEIAAIREEAAAAGLLPVTTEKDLVRIRDAAGIAILPIRAAFEEPERIAALVAEALDRAAGAQPPSRP